MKMGVQSVGSSSKTTKALRAPCSILNTRLVGCFTEALAIKTPALEAVQAAGQWHASSDSNQVMYKGTAGSSKAHGHGQDSPIPFGFGFSPYEGANCRILPTTPLGRYVSRLLLITQ